MPTVQELRIKYTADISELQGRISAIESSLRKVDGAAVSSGKSLKDGFDKGAESAGKMNDEINPLTSGIEDLGKKIIAAFAVERIIAFGIESVKSFAATELAAKSLEFSVTKVIGGTTTQVAKLQAQAQELSKVSYFTPRQINEAQTALAQVGLTADQIEKIIPRISDLAATAKFGGNIQEATSAVIQAIEGRGVALRAVGIVTDATATKTERFNDILQQSGKFEGSMASDLNTTSGEMKKQEQQIDLLSDAVGKKLAPAFIKIKEIGLNFISGLIGAPVDIKLAPVKNPFSDLDFAGLKSKLAEAQAEYDKLNDVTKTRLITDEEKIQAQILKDEINQLSSLIAQKTQGYTLEKLQKEDLSKLTKQQLTDEIAGLKLRSDVGTFGVQDEITRRQEAIKKLAELAKQAAEKEKKERETALNDLHTLEVKATDDLLKNKAGEVSKVEQLEAEKNIAIGKLREKFVQAEFSNSDIEHFKNLGSAEEQAAFIAQKSTDAQKTEFDKLQLAIKETGDAFDILKEKESKALDVKNIEGDLNATVKVLEEFRLKAINELQGAFLAIPKDQQTPAAFQAMNDKIAGINKDFRATELNETIKFDKELVDLNASKDSTLIEAEIKLQEAIHSGNDEAIIDAKKYLDKIKQFKEEEAKIKKQIAEAELTLVKDTIKGITDLINSNYQAQIDAATKNGDAQLALIDQQITANQNAETNKQQSKRDTEAINTKLLAERKKQEEKNAKDLADIKTKQFNFDQQAKVANVLISTFEAIAKIEQEIAVLTTLAFANPLLTPLIALAASQIPIAIGEGAVQIGFILAQKAPQYERGTKRAPSSEMSIVGERGPELMFVPQNSKILPADKTVNFGRAIDAMFDNTWEKYVSDAYITPALMRQKQLYEAQKQQQFAQNVANSFLLSSEGIDEYGMRRVLQKGVPISNIEQLGKIIAKNLSDNSSHFRK